MHHFIKRLTSIILTPLAKWYLRKERTVVYQKITLKVPPGVFHPGLFHSTKFLLEYLSVQHLENKTLLELGCGSGLIAIASAKAGANVTAVDLNANAIKATIMNAYNNDVKLKVIASNLFNNLPRQTFDWIIINPPYYPRAIKNERDLAWHCGENFEYFIALFKTLGQFMTIASSTIMILSQDCDLIKIQAIGSRYDFNFEKIREKKIWIDGKNYLYKINLKSPPPPQQLPAHQ